MSETHDGGCLCGAVRYTTIGEPVGTAVCHCRYCQLNTGTAFGISVFFKQDQVTFNKGECRSYTFETESGNTITTFRCEGCGTLVYSQPSYKRLRDFVCIAGGTFDPPTFWYEVRAEVFTRSKASFCQIAAKKTHEASELFKPIKTDSNRLKGGL